MRTIAVLLLIVSAPLYFFTEMDPHSATALKLLSWTQHLPIPAWSLSLGLSSLMFLLTLKKDTSQPSAAKVPVESHKPVKTQQSTSEPNLESSHSEIELELSQLNMPSSAKFILDKKLNVPFTLHFERSTPMAIKRGVIEFARFLAKHPKPQRVEITLIHPLEGGIPTQNIITGALRQHLNMNEFHLISQEEGFDIKFHVPEEPWISKGNLKNNFSNK